MAWGTRMPKKAGDRYLVTLLIDYGNRQVRQADLVEYPKGNFYWLVLPECSTHYKDVIAWMKEPKPYNKEATNDRS
jgi:hypothetical protein